MPKKKAVASEAKEVTVVWPKGSRVYSEAVHGEDFMALAEEFMKKHGGKVA